MALGKSKVDHRPAAYSRKQWDAMSTVTSFDESSASNMCPGLGTDQRTALTVISHKKDEIHTDLDLFHTHERSQEDADELAATTFTDYWSHGRKGGSYIQTQYFKRLKSYEDACHDAWAIAYNEHTKVRQNYQQSKDRNGVQSDHIDVLRMAECNKHTIWQSAKRKTPCHRAKAAVLKGQQVLRCNSMAQPARKFKRLRSNVEKLNQGRKRQRA